MARRKCALCSGSERLCAEGSAAVIETPPQLWVIYCSRFLTFRGAEAGRCFRRSSFDGNVKVAETGYRPQAVAPVAPDGASIESGDQPRRAAEIGLVFVAELRAQQPFFRANARDQRRDKESREQHTNPRAKGKGPAKGQDQHSEIARVADDAKDTVGDQRMPALDGDQPAEAMAEHKYRPHPQRATASEQSNAEPPDGLPIHGPEPRPVGIGRQIGFEEPD